MINIHILLIGDGMCHSNPIRVEMCILFMRKMCIVHLAYLAIYLYSI